MLKVSKEELQKERQLSQFTMENIHEAVFWIDSGQHIIQLLWATMNQEKSILLQMHRM